MSEHSIASAVKSGAPVLSQAPAGLLQRKCACGQHTMAGECEECKKGHSTLNRQPDRTGMRSTVPGIVDEVLHASGQPLEGATRQFMESRFHYDFSRVRVHTDQKAAESAQAVNAKAYTVGTDIVFNLGAFSPGTLAGRRLLAHELTHVVQQDVNPQRNTRLSRAPADAVSVTAGSGRDQSDATTRLLMMADEVELVHAQAIGVLKSKGAAGSASEITTEPLSSGAVHPINYEYVHALSGLASRLRAVAETNNEKLKLQVLSGFNPIAIKSAKAKVQNGAPETDEVITRRPVGLAASSLQVSSPQDSAEIEADRIASALLVDKPIAIGRPLTDGVLSRQAGAALMGAGEAILGFEAAGGAEAEAATGPPGWVVGGVILLAAGVLIGAGYLMSRGKSRGKAAEKAEPQTGSPSPPPPDLCRTAIKILTQFERLAEKFGLKLPAKRIEELNRLRDAGEITINHLPGSLRSEFPLGTFGDMTLAAIRALCKM